MCSMVRVWQQNPYTRVSHFIPRGHRTNKSVCAMEMEVKRRGSLPLFSFSACLGYMVFARIRTMAKIEVVGWQSFSWRQINSIVRCISALPGWKCIRSSDNVKVQGNTWDHAYEWIGFSFCRSDVLLCVVFITATALAGDYKAFSKH